MKSEPKRPSRQPETLFIGDVQKFSGPVFAADDPRLEPRVRKGRPGDATADDSPKPRRKKKS